MGFALGIGKGYQFRRRRISRVPSFFDQFGTPAVAYSLRDLSGTNPNVLNVRRSSDNATQDFKVSEITNGTLAAWVGVGNEGFVTTWYDQTGNGNDATQASASSQPKIVSAGSVILDNGKATLEFDGSNDYMESGAISSSQPVSYLHLRRYRTLDQVKHALNFSTDSGYAWADYFDGGNLRAYFGSTVATASGYNTNQNLWAVIANGASSTASLNGSQFSASVGSNNIDAITIGRRAAPIAGVNAAINSQEIILYLSDIGTTDLSGIEANINDFYSIY